MIPPIAVPKTMTLGSLFGKESQKVVSGDWKMRQGNEESQWKSINGWRNKLPSGPGVR